MHLRDATFVVTDTETTGTHAAQHRVIEVAAVKVQGGKIVDRFSSLINPGRSVPRRITALTGISTAMVFDAPPAAEVLPQYLDFLGEGVFVAHNAPFDQRFLDAELARLGQPPLANPVLCTLRLARRLLRGLRSKSLGSVAEFYGLKNPARHRAAGDAEVTAEILLRFLSRLEYQEGVAALAELLTYQNRRYAQPKAESSHLKRIREERLPLLPDRPGVYFMRNGRGAILYIGKAASLAKRVRSYFTAIEAKESRIRKLVEAVRDVTWEETGSDLGALLLESKLIKQHQPRFNRALRRYRNRPFIRVEVADAFPRVTWQSYVQDDGAEYFGPLGGRRQAELVVDLINRHFLLRECDDVTFARHQRCLYADLGRCLAPCVESVEAAYAEELTRVRAFLMGEDRSLLTRIETAMREAASRMEYEQARLYRDDLQRLERLLDKQQCIAMPVLDHHAVVVLPGAEAGTAQLFLVRFGRLAEVVDVPDRFDEATRAEVRARLAVHFDPALPRPQRYFKQEVEEVRLLAHWLYVHRAATQQVAWDPSQPLDAFLDTIADQVAHVHDEKASVGWEAEEEG